MAFDGTQGPAGRFAHISALFVQNGNVCPLCNAFADKHPQAVPLWHALLYRVAKQFWSTILSKPEQGRMEKGVCLSTISSVCCGFHNPRMHGGSEDVKRGGGE
eukprot:277439-Chlamydomonas_euryale.AAC.1